MTTPNKIYRPHFPRSQGSAFPWGEAPWRADPLLKNGICINLVTEQPLSSIFFSACAKAVPLGESGRVGALCFLRKRTQRVGVAEPYIQQEPVSFTFFLAPWWKKCHPLCWQPLWLSLDEMLQLM